MRISARTSVLAKDEPDPMPECAILTSHLEAVGFDAWSTRDGAAGLWPFVTRAPVPLYHDSRPVDCWNYRRPDSVKGGGATPRQIWVGSERWTAARVAWVLGTEGLGPEAEWLLGPDARRIPGRPLRHGERVVHNCRVRSKDDPEGDCCNPAHLGIAGPDLTDEELRFFLSDGAAAIVHPPGRYSTSLPYDHPRAIWWRNVLEQCQRGRRPAWLEDDPVVLAQRRRRLDAFSDHFWSRTSRDWGSDPVLDEAWVASQIHAAPGTVDAWNARIDILTRWQYQHPPRCWDFLGDITGGTGQYYLGKWRKTSPRFVAWQLAVTGDVGGAPRLDIFPGGVRAPRWITTSCGRPLCVRNDVGAHHLVATGMPTWGWDVVERTGWRIDYYGQQKALIEELWLTERAAERALKIWTAHRKAEGPD